MRMRPRVPPCSLGDDRARPDSHELNRQRASPSPPPSCRKAALFHSRARDCASGVGGHLFFRSATIRRRCCVAPPHKKMVPRHRRGSFWPAACPEKPVPLVQAPGFIAITHSPPTPRCNRKSCNAFVSSEPETLTPGLRDCRKFWSFGPIIPRPTRFGSRPPPAPRVPPVTVVPGWPCQSGPIYLRKVCPKPTDVPEPEVPRWQDQPNPQRCFYSRRPLTFAC